MKALLQHLLEEAIRKNVSDIHFTHKQGILHIAMREMNGMKSVDTQADPRFLVYLRYLTRMNLSSGMLPQTGQLQMTVLDQTLFLRFSYLPALDVETGVLRILNQSIGLQLSTLSFLPSQTAAFKKMLARPHGLLLVSGPTGSGKTTTLYAMLDYLKEVHHSNIITLEDPIEVKKDGMIQLQINDQQNLTYEEGLKQILRHDPDVIMVGEIRDAITARMVLRCALTGHLVLSTIHAKDCAGVLARLRELDISQTDIHQSLFGIINQRIFRQKGKRGKICLYEIMDETHLSQFQQSGYSPHEKMAEIVACAIEHGYLTKTQAIKEGVLFAR